MMLEVRNLSVAYGGHQALHEVALLISAGEIVVILGANGAGKTTLLNTIAGLFAPKPGGSITFHGRELIGTPAHRIVEHGIALVPEGRRIFGELSVRDNLTLGSFARRARGGREERLKQMLALFPRLAERSHQMARTMSGGEQQMLAIARALMTAPELLLLDEPSLGLSPLLSRELFAALGAIGQSGVAILLVEQNANRSLQLAGRAYLLENGRIAGEGTSEALRQDERVARSYLGL
jgi:branched-chain amino acid transport system ATP-binding protein